MFCFFAQPCIYSTWMTELQRIKTHRLVFFVLVLGGAQTLFATEREHHVVYQCQVSLTSSSCRRYSGAIIRLGTNLCVVLDLDVFYRGSVG